LAHFKTVDAIRQASEEQLIAVVNLKVTRAILDHFSDHTSGK